MMIKKVAVLAANGLGDGLIMQIAAHSLGGILCTDQTDFLSSLFPDVAPWPTDFDAFDDILIENDNSKRCWDLMRNREQWPQMRFIFPTLNPRLKVKSQDFVCDPKIPMAQNVAKASGCDSVENGIWKPEEARFRMVRKRVAIHPTSRDPKRNWSKNQFAELAQNLAWEGFFPAFLVSQDERKEWEWVEEKGFALPRLDGVRALATFIYEAGYFIGNDSGLGHLASNLGIPTLTLSGNNKRVQLWRPGFTHNQTVTPVCPLPHFKGFSLRNRWQPFVSMPRVLKAFRRMTCNA